MNHSPWSMHHEHGNNWKPNCVWWSILFTAFLSRRSNFFLIALFCKIWIWETFLIWGFEFFEYSKCNLSIRLSISVFKFSPSYWGLSALYHVIAIISYTSLNGCTHGCHYWIRWILAYNHILFSVIQINWLLTIIWFKF